MFKIFLPVFLYCNHQVHRNFFITLYNHLKFWLHILCHLCHSFVPEGAVPVKFCKVRTESTYDQLCLYQVVQPKSKLQHPGGSMIAHHLGHHPAVFFQPPLSQCAFIPQKQIKLACFSKNVTSTFMCKYT
jgi:hypothetical protein